MERFSEKEMQRQLRQFEPVWRRVEALRSPRDAAERCGVKLMPKQRRCGRREISRKNDSWRYPLRG